MKREEKIDWLIQYLKKENAGYAAIQEPVNLVEKTPASAESDECALADGSV